MFFRIVSGAGQMVVNNNWHAYLFPDNWDDWFEFKTMFSLVIIDPAGNQHQIGSVKIGQVGLKPGRTVEPGHRAPALPSDFDALPPDFFSVGQGEDYYQSINKLPQAVKDIILVGLRDCAFDTEIFRAARHERCMEVSLLRDISEKNVTGRLHRLTRGDAQLTRFDFSYIFPRVSEDIEPPVLSFNVQPEVEPPTNVHVLIGRNGVGKTHCMRNFIEALLGRQPEDGRDIGKAILSQEEGEWAFAGLVLISFSAFDDFELKAKPDDLIGSHQVGLRQQEQLSAEGKGVKTSSDLAVDFRKSLQRCRQDLRIQRWKHAISMLEVDDLFAEAGVRSLLELADDEFEKKAEHLFSRLSSGHAIVLLTITRLVELVDEKTLVLLDEPEGHLHPPLLSAFIRCLSDLLVKRNGVAIIATHSPVVLQEVPRTCAWKLRRSRALSVAERPSTETFGENIGVLTREVFGLEVTRAGFHQLIANAVDSGLHYDDVLARFGGQLGMEGRAIARALIAERDIRV